MRVSFTFQRFVIEKQYEKTQELKQSLLTLEWTIKSKNIQTDLNDVKDFDKTFRNLIQKLWKVLPFIVKYSHFYKLPKFLHGRIQIYGRHKS